MTVKEIFHGYLPALPHLVNTAEVEGQTVRECLEAFVARYPGSRACIYSDKGTLGRDYAGFADKVLIRPSDLDIPVEDGSQLDIVCVFDGG